MNLNSTIQVDPYKKDVAQHIWCSSLGESFLLPILIFIHLSVSECVRVVCLHKIPLSLLSERDGGRCTSVSLAAGFGYGNCLDTLLPPATTTVHKCGGRDGVRFMEENRGEGVRFIGRGSEIMENQGEGGWMVCDSSEALKK